LSGYTDPSFPIRQPLEPSDTDHLVDLSKIDFEALKARFEKSRKHIETEKLRSAINLKLMQMVPLNKSRMNYIEKFQKMIDEYNSSSFNVETFFASLVEFAQELNAEEKRGIAEKLTEEELAIFDLLIKPEMALKKEKLVLDWRKRQQSRAAVRLSIDEILDRLPRSYIPDLYRHKCDVVYQHIYDSYFGQGLSIYSHATK
jgi:type I restriction enzyme R subunit